MNFTLLEPLTPVQTVVVSTAITLLKMTLVLLTALAVTRLMRRSSAGARHVVWLVALSAALVLPLLSAWAPVPVRVLPAVAARPAAATSPAPIETQALIPAPPSEPARTAASDRSASTPTTPARRAPIGAGTVLLILWSLGAAALLIRLAAGVWAVRRIVRGARVLEQPDWQRPLYEVADRLGLDEAPLLLQSDRVEMPFATGFLKTHIVLPADSEEWSEERRTAVLIHELGHIRRRDLIGHTVSRVVCALYWFHPLVWTAARRLRAESERACDDLALVLGARPSEYAEHLLEIVTQVRDHAIPAVALAMAKPNEFEGRMLAILDPRLHRKGPSRAQTAWLVGSLTVVALVLGAVSPARRVAATPSGSEPRGTLALLAPDQGEAPESKAAPQRAADQIAVVEPHQETDESTAAKDEGSADQDADSDSDADASADAAHAGQRAEVLAKTLRNDSSPEVRRVAAWGLSQYARTTVAAKALADAVTREDDEDVREMAVWALAEAQGNASAIAALNIAFRRDQSAKVRRTAAWAAGQVGDRSSVEGLITLLADSDPDTREVAAWSIGSCGPAHAPAALIRALSDPDPSVRLSVAWALSEIGDAAAADPLEAAFRREKDPEVQHGLIKAMGAMGDRAIETLSRLVDSSDPEIRAVAVAALAGGNATGPWPWPRPEPRPYP